jgi:hypothetical protein
MRNAGFGGGVLSVFKYTRERTWRGSLTHGGVTSAGMLVADPCHSSLPFSNVLQLTASSSGTRKTMLGIDHIGWFVSNSVNIKSIYLPIVIRYVV